MTLAESLFLILAAVTAASALGVAASRSVIRSAVWLLFTLISVALLFLLLGAEFLSGAQLIIYVGGTMVLLAFGVMLTSGGPYAVLKNNPLESAVAGVIAIIIAGLTTATALKFPVTSSESTLPDTQQLGMTFLGATDAASTQKLAYLLPFEIVSIHLLVVLIAAAYLARAKKRPGGTPS